MALNLLLAGLGVVLLIVGVVSRATKRRNARIVSIRAKA